MPGYQDHAAECNSRYQAENSVVSAPRETIPMVEMFINRGEQKDDKQQKNYDLADPPLVHKEIVDGGRILGEGMP